MIRRRGESLRRCDEWDFSSILIFAVSMMTLMSQPDQLLISPWIFTYFFPPLPHVQLVSFCQSIRETLRRLNSGDHADQGEVQEDADGKEEKGEEEEVEKTAVTESNQEETEREEEDGNDGDVPSGVRAAVGDEPVEEEGDQAAGNEEGQGSTRGEGGKEPQPQEGKEGGSGSAAEGKRRRGKNKVEPSVSEREHAAQLPEAVARVLSVLEAHHSFGPPSPTILIPRVADGLDERKVSCSLSLSSSSSPLSQGCAVPLLFLFT